MFKTRALATAAVNGGKVEINGETCKAAKLVAVGDIVGANTGHSVYMLVVDGLAERRASAKVARALYTETDGSRAERERQAEIRRTGPPLGSELGPRPTKRDRRRIERVRGRGGVP